MNSIVDAMIVCQMSNCPLAIGQKGQGDTLLLLGLVLQRNCGICGY